MEAWKFIEYDAVPPLKALSLTTSRWGLEPFSQQVINSLNFTGATHAGPSHTNIVVLTHGISGLLTVLFAGIIMGCFFSKSAKNSKPSREDAVQPTDLEGVYNPTRVPDPFQSARRPVLQPPLASTSSADKAKEIAHCADLLRQMYRLDIEIWGMSHVKEEEGLRDRQAKQEKADALYAEVRRIIEGLRATADYADAFTEKEREYIISITKQLHDYGREGYQGGKLRYSNSVAPSGRVTANLQPGGPPSAARLNNPNVVSLPNSQIYPPPPQQSFPSSVPMGAPPGNLTTDPMLNGYYSPAGGRQHHGYP